MAEASLLVVAAVALLTLGALASSTHVVAKDIPALNKHASGGDTECVDLVLRRGGQVGWEGANMTIRELCGAREVLAEGITLSPDLALEIHEVCLNTTNGWALTVSGGSDPDLVRWSAERGGESLLAGSAPESDVPLFSHCACEAAVATVVDQCVVNGQVGACVVEPPTEQCCAAIESAVRFGCDVTAASVGVAWGGTCTAAPHSFAQLCGGFWGHGGRAYRINGTTFLWWTGSTLPSEVGLLARLEILKSSYNNLTSVPSELGRLTALQTLALGNNQLSSVPTELGKLTQLRVLGLSVNMLSSLPTELGNLFQLTELFAAFNSLTHVPSELGLLAQLAELNLNGNDFSAVPSEFGNLTQLRVLHLDSWDIRTRTPRPGFLSTLPSELGKLTRLLWLSASGQQLLAVPSQLGNLEQLMLLVISDNHFTAVPSELGDLHELVALSLGGNNLTFVPSEFGNLAQLQYLFLGDQLTWLPSELNRLTNLRSFGVDGNQFQTDVSELPVQHLPISAVGNFLWGCPDTNRSMLFFQYNCMTECSTAIAQRPVSDCMDLEITRQPPPYTNLSMVEIGMEELRPGYRSYLNSPDERSRWLWCASISGGEATCEHLAVNSTSVLVDCGEEGGYALTIKLVANYHDMARCSEMYSTDIDSCNERTDTCFHQMIPCDIDDVFGAEHTLNWIVDHTPPEVGITIASVLGNAETQVVSGAIVAPFDSFVFRLRVSEQFEFDPHRLVVHGCNDTTVEVIERTIEVTCDQVSQGQTVSVVAEEGMAVDNANNHNLGVNATVRAGCGKGKALVGNVCQECEQSVTFADEEGLTECKACSVCGLHEAVRVTCGVAHDTECQCSDGFERSQDGACQACGSGKWRRRSTATTHVDQCEVEELCQACQGCPFPRIAENCDPAHGTQCSTVFNGLAPVTGSLVACLFTLVALSRLNKLKVSDKVQVFFVALTGFADVASDCYFIVYDTRGILRLVSITFVVLPVLVNAWGVHKAVLLAQSTLDMRFKNEQRQPTFKDALRVSFKSYACVLLASCIQPTLMSTVLKDFLPGRKDWYLPEKYKPIQQWITWIGTAPALFQDLPQLVIQSLVLSNSPPTYSAGLAITMTVLSLVTAVALVAFDAIAWRDMPPQAPQAEIEMTPVGVLPQSRGDQRSQVVPNGDEGAELAAARQALEDERAELAAIRQALEDERAELAAIRQALDDKRRSLDQEWAKLEKKKALLEAKA